MPPPPFDVCFRSLEKRADGYRIQVFQIDLRKKEGYKEVLDIINRAIPYPIIAILIDDSECLVSACQKHPHPVNPDNAVIDWMFFGKWHPIADNPYRLQLQKSLDFVYLDLCLQLSGRLKKTITTPELIAFERQRRELKTAIEKLEAAISKSRQFNKKVELNLELKKRKEELVRMETSFEN